MEYVGRLSNLFTSVQSFYNELNPATLSGAIDIIVVKQQDGELACSPFHVRFGKLSVLMPQEKKVEIKINEEVMPYVMKVGEAGEAFFVFETEHEVPEEFQTSPIMSAIEENRSDEEPPYLDIGESKDHEKAQSQSMDDANNSPKSASESDGFDDDEQPKVDTTKLRIPAELQSPKMIIEEQVDKVVTKLDTFPHDHAEQPNEQQQQQHHHHHHEDLSEKMQHVCLDEEKMTMPKNDIYPMDDGASLLERCIPEAITSTTIAKERFIVRPADGDIHNTWMDVTHTSVHTRDSEHDGNNGPAEPTSPRHGDAESIFLDIAGYKTGEEEAEKEQLEHMDPTATREVTREMSSAPTQQLSSATEDSSADFIIKETTPSNENDPPVIEEGEQEQQSTNNKSTGEIKMTPGEIYRIEMSLCGLSALGSDEEKNEEVFNKEQLTYDNFVHNPNILNDQRLVFRHHGHYYAPSHTGPLFTNLLLFQKPLDDQTGTEQEDTAAAQVSDSRDTYSFGRGWRQWLSRSSVAGSTPLPTEAAETSAAEDEEKKNPAEANNGNNETTTYTTTTKTTSVGWNADHSHPAEEPLLTPRKNYAKTLRLTSDQLKSLNLKKGANTITFSVTSAYQGTATCTAKIFYWDYDVSVVISDIDGTITKSDALGHVFTMIGKDWTHMGVAKLYTDVEKNGYHFMYLTSRAIGQADSTRDYLKKVAQSNYQLPEGPVIMSPDRLFTSFHREVIMRKPEVFKMACLRDVMRLFGGRNPFYAGFGNRITDAISYRSVSVPSSRIFTIDANGELKLELLQGFKSSYLHLNDLVDQIFPPINKVVSEEFSDYNFWKAPLPDIDLPELGEPAAPTSPKPKPIIADPSALPARSVVAAPSPPPRRQRGILRSFTSRSAAPAIAPSSSSTTSSTYASSPPSQSSLRVAASSSTPNLLSRQQSQDADDKTSIDEPSSPINSIASSDYPATPIDNNSSSSASSSIVNKVLGGVFSRTFSKSATSLPTSADPQADDDATTNNHTNNNTPTSPTHTIHYEEADDEAFDATLDAIADEIDMDNIPFI
ncbi:lns2-domain-containing protein [Lichtheimia corymbifera JMRC:FSU:9682]|uniref:phosphatidate phosphatase n=1 Tax=Lichtheimia corymbifera JMRC:FSU:9682 TaxID=1263082 RepID=A0A068RGB2_9FUNG|nr:lns2-domain-containing protein [Lichtheimia corymbifera JMRC:FSU:9682]